jgi:hypothetical protein
MTETDPTGRLREIVADLARELARSGLSLDVETVMQELEAMSRSAASRFRAGAPHRAEMRPLLADPGKAAAARPRPRDAVRSILAGLRPVGPGPIAATLPMSGPPAARLEG